MSDGSHIGLLIMAILQKLCPEIIQEGRLCWLKAPIYKVDNKQKSWYYYTEEEFSRSHEKGEITKMKGLGQMTQKDLCESMFSKKNQRLEVLTPSPDGIDILLELMGEDVEPRKEFVEQIDFGGLEL